LARVRHGFSDLFLNRGLPMGCQSRPADAPRRKALRRDLLSSFVIVALLSRIVAWVRQRPTTRGFLTGVTVGSLGLMAGVLVEQADAAFSDVLTVLVGVVALAALVRTKLNSALADRRGCGDRHRPRRLRVTERLRVPALPVCGPNSYTRAAFAEKGQGAAGGAQELGFPL
jgi:hypothetical protein